MDSIALGGRLGKLTNQGLLGREGMNANVVRVMINIVNEIYGP